MQCSAVHGRAVKYSAMMCSEEVGIEVGIDVGIEVGIDTTVRPPVAKCFGASGKSMLNVKLFLGT